MTHRREIELHRLKLVEIRKIMESMKTLAYLETHKLVHTIRAQHELENNLDAMAADFLSFHPEMLPDVETTDLVVLLIGSQRGFCGDFNDALLENWQLSYRDPDWDQASLILVGQKLQARLEDTPMETTAIEGAYVAEDIEEVVKRVVRVVTEKKQPLLAFHAFYHAAKDNTVVSEKLLPPFFLFRDYPQAFPHPPLLNIPPEEFLLDLTDYYLFTALRRILYDSLMAENQKRLQHLENAVSHLDKKSTELIRKGNALRQEEIIEEIEVILLNSSAPGAG